MAESYTTQPGFVAAKEGEYFYGLCDKKQTCGMSCYTFRKRSHALICRLFALVIVLLFLSIVVPLGMSDFLESSIDDSVVISSTSSDSYDMWASNVEGDGYDDVVIWYKLRYFDVRNPTEALKGYKPIVDEVGPYAYREFYEKFDVSFSSDGKSTTYNTYRYYIYDEGASAWDVQPTDTVKIISPTVAGFHIYAGLLNEKYPKLVAKFNKFLASKFEAVEDEINAYLAAAWQKAEQLEDDSGKIIVEAAITKATNSVNAIFDSVEDFMAHSNPIALMLKSMLCTTGLGPTPFIDVNPGPAWFGWTNDSLLNAMEEFIIWGSTELPIEYIPGSWSVAVPGPAHNYTSVEDAIARRTTDTLLTGKGDTSTIGTMINYQNMTTPYGMFVCAEPMKSQDYDVYAANHGTMFPYCEPYNPEWDITTANSKGWIRAFNESDYANRIEGTDGNTFGRPITDNKLQVFIPDIYRSVYMQYIGHNSDWHDVTLYRYSLQAKDLQNATTNPENAQYNAFGPSGVLNGSTANANVPVFISLPHFYQGDASLYTAIQGLSPNEEDHQSFLDIEPQTGLLARARKRLQVNYLMKDVSMPQLEPDALEKGKDMCAEIYRVGELLNLLNQTIPTIDCNTGMFEEIIPCLSIDSNWQFYKGAIYFPYGWVSEEMTMTSSTADSLKDSLFLAENLSTDFQIATWVISVVVVIASLVFLLYSQLAGEHDAAKAALFSDNNNDAVSEALIPDSVFHTA